LYDPFILPQKEDKLILSITQKYVRTFVGGALQSQQNPEDMFKLTTSKMNCHIKLMPYQANENPVVLPVERIEQFQGLADTSIIEEVDDDHIEELVHDTYEDINLSEEEDQENDNNNEENSNFNDNDV